MPSYSMPKKGDYYTDGDLLVAENALDSYATNRARYQHIKRDLDKEQDRVNQTKAILAAIASGKKSGRYAAYVGKDPAIYEKRLEGDLKDLEVEQQRLAVFNEEKARLQDAVNEAKKIAMPRTQSLSHAKAIVEVSKQVKLKEGNPHGVTSQQIYDVAKDVAAGKRDAERQLLYNLHREADAAAGGALTGSTLTVSSKEGTTLGLKVGANTLATVVIQPPPAPEEPEQATEPEPPTVEPEMVLDVPPPAAPQKGFVEWLLELLTSFFR